MKFKKEDVGLYFALSLVGSGTGLLIGAFIASRRGAVAPTYVPSIEEQADAIVQEFTPKKSRKKKPVKKGEKKVDKELEDFIKAFSPSNIQIEMVKSGILTIDELQDTMIQEEIAKQKEPYSYSRQYHDDEKPDLSELARLPEDEEPVGGRYQILQQPPKRKSPKNMRVVYFDQEDGDFYTMTRRKQPVPLGSINEFVSEETWEVMLPYMLGGFAPLFVSDLKNAKWYRFEIVPEDEEESSDDNDPND